MNTFEDSTCDPDCRERAECTDVGVGHTMCGYCTECDLPTHHCGHISI